MGLFDRFKMKEKAPEWKLYTYSEEELAQYEAYIEAHFGPFDSVFHEIVSPDIHLDIIIVPPTPEYNFYKLITMGMGAYRMQVPPELNGQELERAELMLYLPPDWNIQSSREEDYWPIRWLKILARLPINCETWLAAGHTASANEEDTPVAENTGFSSFLLLNGVDLKCDRLDFRLPGGEKLNFYQIFPLYREELRYKQERGVSELLDLFSDEDILPVLNIHRKNYCADMTEDTGR